MVLRKCKFVQHLGRYFNGRRAGSQSADTGSIPVRSIFIVLVFTAFLELCVHFRAYLVNTPAFYC